MAEMVNHPNHYGGKENLYEAIKVIEAWNLNFSLGNVIKYVSRAGKKNNILEDLEKASWYLNREIEKTKSMSIDDTSLSDLVEDMSTKTGKDFQEWFYSLNTTERKLLTDYFNM